MRFAAFLILMLGLPLCGLGKNVKVHGFITEIKSPTEFQIDDYRINRDATLELEFEKDENDPKAPVSFKPQDLRVGTEIEIKGEFDEQTGVLRATNVRVFLTDHITVKRTALLDRVPALNRVGDAWEGQLQADGQRIVVQAATKVTFLPNNTEKKAIKSSQKAKKAAPVAPEEEAGDPLQSLESVRPNTWVNYKGRRQSDGTILAAEVQFKHNELEPGESRLMKDLTPRIKAFKNTPGGELSIRRVGKFRLYPDKDVQAYLQGLGNSLIPEYQRSLPPGDPNKIAFQFHVVQHKVPNAFALANGTVVVHSSFFELVENEAQLAAVVGHEIAHAVQEHTYRQMQYHKKKLFALRMGAAVAAGYGAYSAANLANLVEAAVRNGYSRSLEDQADRLGIEYMIGAGYDPREAPRVWKVMTKAHGDSPTDFFWSSHNNNTTRRSYLMAELKNNYDGLDYSKLRKGNEQFAAVTERVRARAATGKKVKVKL